MNKKDKLGDSLVITKEMLDAINSGSSYLLFAIKMTYDQHIGIDTVFYTTMVCLFYNIEIKRFGFYPRFNSDTWYKKGGSKHKKQSLS